MKLRTIELVGDVGLAVDDEDVPDLDHVAVGERMHRGDRLAVDQCAVRRTEIRDLPGVAAEREPDVLARRVAIGEDEVVLGPPADRELAMKLDRDGDTTRLANNQMRHPFDVTQSQTPRRDSLSGMYSRLRFLTALISLPACGSSSTPAVVDVRPVDVAPADAHLADAAIPDALVASIDAASTSTDAMPVDAACTTDFVYLKDKQLYRHGAPWFPVSVNFEFEIRHIPDASGGPGTYFLAPAHSYCTDNVCCSDPDTCHTMLQTMLAQVKSFGVDSLRMVSLALRPATDGHLYFDCIDHVNGTITACTDADEPVTTSPDLPLQLTDDAVALMKEQGFVGILLAGHGSVDGASSRDLYAAWLNLLASHYSDEPTIFAFDLMNEPQYEASNTGIAKTDANAIVRTWYNAVRSGSQHLMVTMGLGDLTVASAWDAQILPLDFASPHLYTNRAWDDTAQNFLNTQYGWYALQKYPTLIGETSQPVDATATEADQASFASFSFAAAKACGQMGLQWWEYRDVTWSPTELFGLVREDGTMRPAASVFQSVPTIDPAPACFVPMASGNVDPTQPYHTGGSILQPNGLPLANAVVMGWACPSWGTFYWTLTDLNGDFQLDTDQLVIDVRATGAGLSVVDTGVDCSRTTAMKNIGTVQLDAISVDTSVTTPSACYVYPTR